MSTNPAIHPSLQPGPAAQLVLAHYQQSSDRILTVPEWPDPTGAPLRILHNPLTIAERDQLRLSADGRDDTAGTLDYIVRAIILKALHPDTRTPLFTAVDRHILRHQADESVVRRVASVLLGADDPDALAVLNAFQTPDGIAALALFDIAATLSCTVAELRAKLTTEELTAWIAWLKLRGRL